MVIIAIVVLADNDLVLDIGKTMVDVDIVMREVVVAIWKSLFVPHFRITTIVP